MGKVLLVLGICLGAIAAPWDYPSLIREALAEKNTSSFSAQEKLREASLDPKYAEFVRTPAGERLSAELEAAFGDLTLGPLMKLHSRRPDRVKDALALARGSYDRQSGFHPAFAKAFREVPGLFEEFWPDLIELCLTADDFSYRDSLSKLSNSQFKKIFDGAQRDKQIEIVALMSKFPHLDLTPYYEIAAQEILHNSNSPAAIQLSYHLGERPDFVTTFVKYPGSETLHRKVYAADHLGFALLTSLKHPKGAPQLPEIFRKLEDLTLHQFNEQFLFREAFRILKSQKPSRSSLTDPILKLVESGNLAATMTADAFVDDPTKLIRALSAVNAKSTEYDRNDFALAAGESLGRSLRSVKRNPEMESALLDFFTNPKVDRDLRRALRKSLPLEMKRSVERSEIDSKLNQSKTASLCELVCGLVKNRNAWTQPDFSKPDFISVGDSWGWELALKSLSALFLTRAAPYCPKEAQSLNLELAKWFSPREPSSHQKDVADLVRHLGVTGVNLPPAAKKSLHKFASAQSPAPDYPLASAAQIYARTFSRFLASEAPFEISPRATTASIGTALSESLKDPMDHLHDTAGSSLIHIHSLATAALGLAGLSTTQKREVLAILEAEVACSQKLFGNRVSLRYALSSKCTKGEFADESPRSSGPRSVVAHLALYLNSPLGAKRRQSREDLVTALTAYDDYLLDHFELVGRGLFSGSPHDEKDQLMAPYFATSASLYATAALSYLLQDAKGDERTRLLAIKANLERKMKSEFSGSGLFKSQNQDVYPSSATYDNAQMGLALLALIEPQKDTCAANVRGNHLGILNPILNLDHQIDRGFASKAHRSHADP